MAIAYIGTILSFSLTDSVQAQNTEVLNAVNKLQQELGDGWFIDWNAQKTALKGLGIKGISNKTDITESDILQAADMAANNRYWFAAPDEKLFTLKEFAQAFLKNHAVLFQLPTELHDLQIRVTGGDDNNGDDPGSEKSNAYWLKISQTFKGLPVFDRGMDISLITRQGVYPANGSATDRPVEETRYQSQDMDITDLPNNFTSRPYSRTTPTLSENMAKELGLGINTQAQARADYAPKTADVPVEEHQYRGKDIGIYLLGNNYLPGIDISITPTLSKQDILAIVREDARLQKLITSQLPDTLAENAHLRLGVFGTENDQPILAYKLDALFANGDVRATYFVSAHGGTILRFSAFRVSECK
ncbi:MAG: hypothetical protein PHH59_09275 [Methylovulum sp.]|nr:hypothetical protein [Methylovulum sp.]MDD2724194.1 hypothetical protein [Methylovulum sp.]